MLELTLIQRGVGEGFFMLIGDVSIHHANSMMVHGSSTTLPATAIFIAKIVKGLHTSRAASWVSI